MSNPIYLFCGGPAIDNEGRPKPLMKISEDRSLLVHFLLYLKHNRQVMPASVTLLCDDPQKEFIKADLSNLSYPVPIHILACGQQPNTFEKLCCALNANTDRKGLVQFGYPDIFSFDEFMEPKEDAITLDPSVHISVAALTSRFPRLIVDLYSNKVRGISNYSSPVPSNPLHVFGGDLWGRIDQLIQLIEEFRHQAPTPTPNLEYDFFFWLINNDKMHSVMLYGERLLVDSIRDVSQLLARTGHIK